MGTTANYSWPTPVATDLVKDGWEAIKDLGDAADTTVKAVSDAQGLVHINQTSWSGVSSASINDVFSATYDNYLVKILMKVTNTGDVTLRFRVGGSDASGANYNDQFFAAENTGGQFNRTTGATAGNSMRVEANQQQSCELLFGSPFLTEPSSFEFRQVLNHASPQIRLRAGFHTLSTSYTGFSLIAGAGTMTGYCDVFGFKKG